MPSTVFFIDIRANLKRSLVNKIDELIAAVDLAGTIKPDGLTALKLHFGELGNTAYIRPVFVRRFVDAVKAAGGQPFLTDANTLYVGSRSVATNHLNTAVTNGFAYSVVGAPLIIADGLKGQSSVAVPVDLPECAEAHIGAEVVEADSIISLSHFKGHEVSGFGGAIKNLGMGAASRRGKLFMHSNITPVISPERCISCGTCIQRCPGKAIKLVPREGEPAPLDSQNPKVKAQKDPDKCIGCGDCVLACPAGAIEIGWNAEVPDFLRRMVAYTKGVMAGKQERSAHFSFLTQISPACDCYPFNDAPLVADIGILASRDLVAIDQASVDLVNQAPGLPGTELKHAHAPGEDKFRDLYPRVDWDIQLEYAQEIGLGSREYELVKI
ncbi:MAG: DUF362 domain-containing protein [Desulfarculaceae bacterium]|nr:DUF362 domain-containing protein [Desulfarculaceae bacterium]MCF8073067.1 DUF362 domain-containing protein [Desulfarculaceae bacterium]MCF8101848.1 DUF362 domain-containing protein [Desulfarculaceae bacterium]MCF8115375.1 DUF362 domain-containing protein [Desulfarculaceae bacterium]